MTNLLISEVFGSGNGGMFIGICSVVDAERGAYIGLLLAWEAGCGNIVLEVDCLEVLRFLRNDYNGLHPLSKHLSDLRNRNWIVKVQHVRHDENKMADALAKSASFNLLDVIILASAPAWVEPLLLADSVNH
ncbi:hypothetical protein F3Y22_tig00003041pilonHSYRG00407 [Hibiscus syriacus]|uniref:RNase H type-1 domain-containing protein n=1 Tax=Hibiscus syriacus TaxID=106335 RepID=A0A6A3CRW7_HIBSY|nr:hypothetical protein F3Y22_tig00003041pilonHSYRG00407 [Hibiscus syriacus]